MFLEERIEQLERRIARLESGKCAPIELSRNFELRVEDILTFVSAQTGVTRNAILGRTRVRSVCWPRHAAIWLAAQLTAGSIREMGTLIGNRNHGTVLNSINNVNDRRDTEPEFRALTDGWLARLSTNHEPRTANSPP